MGRIEIHDVSENKWLAAREFLTPKMLEEYEKYGDARDIELNAPIRLHEMGDESSLQLFEVRVPPNTSVDVHSHEQDEIMYVVAGVLNIGKRSLKPGSSVFIQGNTLYGFSSGPEGLHFLNFRPRKDVSYRSKEEHLSMLKEQKD